MRQFIINFTKALERWLEDNNLRLVEPVEMIRLKTSPTEGENFLIGSAVEHTISMELQAFEVGFGKHFGPYDPSDVQPTVKSVTDALTHVYWPGR